MRVFISHSHNEEDNLLAKGISEALAEQGFEVFNPEREILPGDNWLLAAGRALERADAVVVIVSPQWLESPWLRSELQYVTSHEKYEDRLIPVRVGIPLEELPWLLRSMPVVDASGFKHTAEQIAHRLKDSTSMRAAKTTASRRH